MSNMSYCRMENTSQDLQDCLCTLAETDEFPELDLSRSELLAYLRLRDQCAEFLQEFDRLSATMHTVAE
jgi:hypothetical protein